MKIATTYVILLLKLFLSTQKENDTVLLSVDKCGKIKSMSIYYGNPYLIDAGPEYKNISFYKGIIAPASREEVEKDVKSNAKKHKFSLVLSFDYRIKGQKMFFLTSLVGSRKTIPIGCKIQEEVLFDLEDSIGMVRSLSKGSCDGNIHTQLLSKERSVNEVLYTYSMKFQGVNDVSYIKNITFNDSFTIKNIIFYNYVMVFKKLECKSDSVLVFK